MSVLEGSIAKIIQMKEKSLSYLGLELSFRVSKFKFYFRICCVIWRNFFPPNIYISIKTIFSGTCSWMCLHVQITIFSQILCYISSWFLICQNCRAQSFFLVDFFWCFVGFCVNSRKYLLLLLKNWKHYYNCGNIYHSSEIRVVYLIKCSYHLIFYFFLPLMNALIYVD